MHFELCEENPIINREIKGMYLISSGMIPFCCEVRRNELIAFYMAWHATFLLILQMAEVIVMEVCNS